MQNLVSPMYMDLGYSTEKKNERVCGIMGGSQETWTGKKISYFLGYFDALTVSPLYCIKPTEKYMESMSREH